MDVLARITKLRLDRGWTDYELAKRSGLPQSTISSWYTKNMLPSISSLESICKGLGISLSQFFLNEESGEATVLSRQQLRLISYYPMYIKNKLSALLLAVALSVSAVAPSFAANSPTGGGGNSPTYVTTPETDAPTATPATPSEMSETRQLF